MPISNRQPGLIRRTMRKGLLCTFVITVLCVSGGQSGWGMSYLWGALISLFSLISLAGLVPRLLHPSAPQSATFLLSLLLFLKLPLYALALYVATRMPGFSPVSLIAGAILIPMLLASDALKGLRQEAQKPAPLVPVVPSEETAKLKRATQSLQALHAELTGKRG